MFFLGARESAFRNLKSIAECLADELMNAAKVRYYLYILCMCVTGLVWPSRDPRTLMPSRKRTSWNGWPNQTVKISHVDSFCVWGWKITNTPAGPGVDLGEALSSEKCIKVLIQQNACSAKWPSSATVGSGYMRVACTSLSHRARSQNLENSVPRAPTQCATPSCIKSRRDTLKCCPRFLECLEFSSVAFRWPCASWWIGHWCGSLGFHACTSQTTLCLLGRQCSTLHTQTAICVAPDLHCAENNSECFLSTSLASSHNAQCSWEEVVT